MRPVATSFRFIQGASRHLQQSRGIPASFRGDQFGRLFHSSVSFASNPSSRIPSRPPHAPKIVEKPSYDITFTCDPCGTRSSHRISKQGYHYGSILVTCPECKNRHVISDHLNIFGDRDITIEDLMRERGQLVKRGSLSEDEDVEFWEDTAEKKKREDEERRAEAERRNASWFKKEP
ncbi:DNL zinc finger family protein [Xylogone sp. PMI_703]|nr:DNL zinc finger family protein [Xylogone sp. PMI_703]